MDNQLQKLAAKKQRLDAHRPLPVELVKNLDEWFRVELTYTSNAIEGNTLTRAETALVVEKGITVAGKSLKEHLETTNHVEALEYIKALVGKTRRDITKNDISDIDKLILNNTEEDNGGRYKNRVEKASFFHGFREKWLFALFQNSPAHFSHFLRFGANYEK